MKELDRREINSEPYKVALDFLGGAMEVGASAFLVKICGQRILLDAGIRQKAGADPLPDFRRIQERGGIDAIVVSHAHMDHTGSLPVISKAYPNARVYMTSMSIDLTRVLLYDSIKLMNRQEEGIPHYAEKDVEQLFGRMMAMRYEQPMEILPGITLTFYQAGHIAGAACVYLQSKEGTLFYSGDFSAFAQNTIEGIRIPKLRPDVAIVESTYGDRLHSNRQVEEQVLVDTAAECIEKGGKMLIPTFALGRAQEVLLILKRAMNKGELPKVPVYVDGMVRDMNTAYARNPWFLKNALAKRAERGGELFYSDEIVPVRPNESREELLKKPGAAIFVASSGMLTGGPSVEYAKKIAPMENGYIVITGYQDEEAPGRQIVELLEDQKPERFLTLNGIRVPVRCTLKRVGLSAHADKAEIESLLERLSARNVFLVHGDKEVIPKLAQDLDLDYRTRIFVPKDGDSEEIYLKSPRQQLKKSFPWSMQREKSLRGNEKKFYQYLQTHYPNGKFTLDELAYIWSGKHVSSEGTICASEVLSEKAEVLPTKVEPSETPARSEDPLEEFQQILTESPYFDRDAKSLFLFVCRSEEEIRETQKKAETVTPQRLQSEIEICFADFSYRKISYFMDREEVSLLFDFPKEVEDRFDAAAEAFQERTGWTVTKNDEPNEHAMQTWLQMRFGSAVQKISIRKTDAAVAVRLARRPDGVDIPETIQEFERKTGYSLILEGTGLDLKGIGTDKLARSQMGMPIYGIHHQEAPSVGEDASHLYGTFGAGDVSVGNDGGVTDGAVAGNGGVIAGGVAAEISDRAVPGLRADKKKPSRDGYFRPNSGNQAEPVEQNLAMSCIDMEFTGEKYVPYKKSVMNDQYGKYIQLSFLSPALGIRQQETIQRIADRIGWRVRIAPGVNQNTIQSIAQQICRENGVELKKMPSYLPGTQTLVLKLAGANTQLETLNMVCQKIEEETGLACQVQ